MNSYDIVKRPIITEHSMDQMADRKYTFEVAPEANKIEIKKAVEEIFGVKVEKVTKRPDWKKAIVKITEDSKTIEFFDGLM